MQIKKDAKDIYKGSLNGQLIVKSVVLVAVLLSLYSTYGYKKIALNSGNIPLNKEKLNNITVISSFISLATSLYFLGSNYLKYLSSEDKSIKQLLDANILSTVSYLIQFSTLRSNPKIAEIIDL